MWVCRMRMFVHLRQDLERVRCRRGLRGEGLGYTTSMLGLGCLCIFVKI